MVVPFCGILPLSAVMGRRVATRWGLVTFARAKVTKTRSLKRRDRLVVIYHNTGTITM
jgi:hypothetical protein